MPFRIYTNADIDPYGLGRWVVEHDGRIWFRGNAFECAQWAAEQR